MRMIQKALFARFSSLRTGHSVGRFRLIAGVGLFASQASFGQGTSASTALDFALSRQRALSSYTEHSFGRLPIMPGAVDAAREAIVDQIKDRAVQAVQNKVAVAAAKAPVVSDLAARAMAQAQPGDEPVVVVRFGPETEMATTEHANRRQHQVLSGVSEIIRANGQMATKVNLGSLIAQMHVATAATGYEAFEQARSVRASIKDVVSQLQQGGIGLLSTIVDALGQIETLLATARSTAELVTATARMERLSGNWQCEPDPLDAAHHGRRIEVVQLADETLGGTPAHVYLEVRDFAPSMQPAAAGPPAADDDELPQGSQVRIQTWVGIADGLPLRSQFSMPGGQSQRIEYSYAPVPEITFPACANQP